MTITHIFSPSRQFTDLIYTIRQGSLIGGFAACGKEEQLISGFPNAETEQRSPLTAPSGLLATTVQYCLFTALSPLYFA